MKTDLKGQTAHTPALPTGSKRRLIRLSQPNWETFYDDWSSGELDIPYCSCLSTDLYFVYRQWCHRAGERPTTDVKTMTYIGLRESKLRLKYKTPNMMSAKQAMIINIDMPYEYPNDKCANQQEWLGKQIQEFKLAINSVYDPKSF
jgi:putative DNA primase/helicase